MPMPCTVTGMEIVAMDTVKRGASAKALAQFAPFSGLEPQALQRLAETSTLETVPAGRLLFKPGEREQQRVFLLAGEVALVSDSRAMDHVQGGSVAARRELGQERPRQLWGWTRSRVQVLAVPVAAVAGAETVAPAAVPASQPGAVPDTQVAALQQAVQAAEQGRERAEAQARELQQRLAELQRALERAERRSQPAPSQPAEPAPSLAAAMVAPGVDETAHADLPSLRLRSDTRDTPAAEEIDDLLSAWAPGACPRAEH